MTLKSRETEDIPRAKHPPYVAKKKKKKKRKRSEFAMHEPETIGLCTAPTIR